MTQAVKKRPPVQANRWRNVKGISHNPDNPKYITQEAQERLMQSITEFLRLMELRPLLIRDDGLVLDGNQRLSCIQAKGWTQIPESWVKVVKGLTPEQERELIVKTGMQYGSWDWGVLFDDWNLQQLEDWGFMVDYTKEPGYQSEGKEHEEHTAGIETNIQPGDRIELGRHVLYCGDASNPEHVAEALAGTLAEAVITDPPYGVDFRGSPTTKQSKKIENDALPFADLVHFAGKVFDNIQANTIPGAPVYCFTAGVNCAWNYAMQHHSLGVRQSLIWLKDTARLQRSGYHMRHELILHSWNPKGPRLWYADRAQNSVFEAKRPRANKLHPTMKPPELLEQMLLHSTKPGDTVLDLFGGSGSTLMAAEYSNRRAVLIELDPRYCQTIVNRYHAGG